MEDEECWQVVSTRYCSKSAKASAKASTERKSEHAGEKVRPARDFAFRKRGDRDGCREGYREDARRTSKTQRTEETEVVRRQLQEPKKDPGDSRARYSSSNVSSLIGKPVVLGDRQLPDSQQSGMLGKRGQRGGLLFVNHREVFGGSGSRPDRRERDEDALFDVLKEKWPGMSNEVSCVSMSDIQVQDNSLNLSDWSAVVKNPPKPRPRTNVGVTLDKDHKDTDSDGNSGSAGVDGEGELRKDEGRKSEKKKKKKKKKRGNSSEEVRRSDEPVTLALGDMFAMLEKTTPPAASAEKTRRHQLKLTFGTGTPMVPASSKQLKSDLASSARPVTMPRNMMDSSAPTAMRGKEREVPKKRKPSSLRKVITKEKEEKKRLRGLGESIPESFDITKDQSPPSQAVKEDDVMDFEPVQQDPSPPLPKGLHNRRFREYCDHVITKEINDTLQELLQDLVRFQDRVYHNDPLKYRSKRRYVCGLHETIKHLKLGKIRCVVLPPNLEKIQSTGGINEHVQTILSSCSEKNIPVVFALTRRGLGWVLRKPHRVGCVGIFSYAGSEQKFRRLMGLVLEAREEYEEKRKLGLPVVKQLDIDDTAVPDSVLDQSADEGKESYSEDSATEQPDSEMLPSSEWAELFGPSPAVDTGSQSVDLPLTKAATTNRGNGTFFWNPNAPIFQPQFSSTFSPDAHVS